MQVYQDPVDSARIMLGVAQCPAMLRLLLRNPLAQEMEFDEANGWVTMSAETWRELRQALPKQLHLDSLDREPAPPRKRRRPSPPPPPPMRWPLRTTTTQTDTDTLWVHSACQTDLLDVQSRSTSPMLMPPPPAVAVAVDAAAFEAFEPAPASEAPPSERPQGNGLCHRGKNAIRDAEDNQSLFSGFSNLYDVHLRRLRVSEILRD